MGIPYAGPSGFNLFEPQSALLAPGDQDLGHVRGGAQVPPVTPD
jgi:hypothetical protein